MAIFKYECLQPCTSAVRTPWSGWIDQTDIGSVEDGVMGGCGCGCVADIIVGHYKSSWGEVTDVSGKGAVAHTL